MREIAIILDSFSGRTKEYVEQHEDQYFLPLKIIVDGVEYKDGVDKSPEDLLKIVNNGEEVKTSQPSPAEIEDLFNELSNKYKHVIYLSLGSALSGTFQTAKMFASSIENVHVVNTRLVGKNFEDMAEWILNNKEMELNTLLQKIENYSKDFTTFIIPKNNDAFIKGGRLGKTLALVLNKAKVVPIIAYDDSEKLKKKMIKRSGRHAVKYGIEKLIDIAHKHGIDKDIKWQICNTLDKELVDIAIDILDEKGYRNVHVELTSALINSHTGDGAMSLGFLKEFK